MLRYESNRRKTDIMQPNNITPTGNEPVTPPTNVQPQVPIAPSVVQPAANAQTKHGFDTIDRAKQQKRVPLLYVSAILSYVAIVFSLLTFSEAQLYSYAGVAAGGVAGLAGYRMGNKPLAIVGYIPFGINAVILLITQFII